MIEGDRRAPQGVKHCGVAPVPRPTVPCPAAGGGGGGSPRSGKSGEIPRQGRRRRHPYDGSTRRSNLMDPLPQCLLTRANATDGKTFHREWARKREQQQTRSSCSLDDLVVHLTSPCDNSLKSPARHRCPYLEARDLRERCRPNRLSESSLLPRIIGDRCPRRWARRSRPVRRRAADRQGRLVRFRTGSISCRRARPAPGPPGGDVPGAGPSERGQASHARHHTAGCVRAVTAGWSSVQASRSMLRSANLAASNTGCSIPARFCSS